MSDSKEESIGFWGVVSIGVGGMVGGGIFAVLGLSATMAGGATPVAFAVAGVVALLTAYSYSKLSVSYPSQGGTVIFLDKAFGVNLMTGSMNTLLWLSYIVTLSLYAAGFSSYFASLVGLDGSFWNHVLISLGIIVPTALNLLSPSLVSKTETYVVFIKVLILLIVLGFGFTSIDSQRLMPETWGSAGMIISSGMIVFVAYEGFELIANTSSDVKDPEKTLPRAYYTSVIFVIALYILTAMVTVGSLDAEAIKKAADFALAKAAAPSMGQVGFTMVGVAAVMATFSAINATLYGSARLAYTISEEKEVPPFLKKKLWNQPVVGLLMTAGVALIMANLMDVESISMLASAGFLIVFGMVNAASYYRSEEVKSSKPVAALGVISCIAALAALLWHTWGTDPHVLWFLLGMIVMVVVIEVANLMNYEHHLKPRFTK